MEATEWGTHCREQTGEQARRGNGCLPLPSAWLCTQPGGVAWCQGSALCLCALFPLKTQIIGNVSSGFWEDPRCKIMPFMQRCKLHLSSSFSCTTSFCPLLTACAPYYTKWGAEYCGGVGEKYFKTGNWRSKTW